MEDKHKSFYLKLREQANQWANKNLGEKNKWKDYLLLAPDIYYLLAKLISDPEVPNAKKVKLGLAIAYFISPIDLMPEIFFGPIGFLDDIALAAYVLNDLLNELDPKIIKKHWLGEVDLLNFIKTVVANAHNMLGASIVKRIKDKIGKA